VTILCVGKPGVLIPAGDKGFLFSSKFSNFFGTHPSSYQKDTKNSFPCA